MQFSNTKEDGLESIIVNWLVNQNDYEQGTNVDYNRDYAIDETRLFRFLQDTQPDALEKLGVFKTDIKKKQFLNRLQGEIAKRGVIDVLRNGVKVYPANLIMFYLTPTENNAKAKEMYEKNIFSITRQLMYSNDSTRLALDMCIFINGLPVITFELKNQLTKQNVDDAVQQYKDDRDPRELLFQFKRCMVHFAVDDARVKFCTKLDGKKSWFLPFDKGYNDGAGNPPNPDGLMTDYLWKKILTKDKFSRIIENYAQVVIEEDPETKKKSAKQIFPRYHQLDCVEKLLADVKTNGVGKRYLIQHSAGSGKSNSIAWLAHQLIGLEKDGHPMIDSVLVVTDRRISNTELVNVVNRYIDHDGYKLVVSDTIGDKNFYKCISTRIGVQGEVKNIIFAAKYKPEIVFDDALNNDIRITKNENQCLIYNRPIPPTGVMWNDLVDWYAEEMNIDENREIVFIKRLCECLDTSFKAQGAKSGPETWMLQAYYNLKKELGKDLPALIPQVYLYYDPQTLKQRGYKLFEHQKMDFLMVFSHKDRVVIEIDGRQHYAEGNSASPRLYSEMVRAQREMTLFGYDVYRFGGYEFVGADSDEKKKEAVLDDLKQFFLRLFSKYSAL